MGLLPFPHLRDAESDTLDPHPAETWSVAKETSEREMMRLFSDILLHHVGPSAILAFVQLGDTRAVWRSIASDGCARIRLRHIHLSTSVHSHWIDILST